MGKKRKLLDEYRFPGFRPRAETEGIFGDPKARVIKLERTQKKQYAGNVGRFIRIITTRRCGGYETYHVGIHGYIWKRRFGGYYAESVGK
jgi:hypothetical protein